MAWILFDGMGVAELTSPGTRRCYRWCRQVPRYEIEASRDGHALIKLPVYSVLPSNTLAYTIQKLLASKSYPFIPLRDSFSTANAHRLFVTDDNPNSPKLGNSVEPLSGIVSIVDGTFFPHTRDRSVM